MKIPELIIEKYQLMPEPAHIGEAVLYNLLQYKSKLPGFESVTFLECDFAGRPSEYIHYVNTAIKRDGRLTREFLNDAPIDKVLKIIA